MKWVNVQLDQYFRRETCNWKVKNYDGSLMDLEMDNCIDVIMYQSYMHSFFHNKLNYFYCDQLNR